MLARTSEREELLLQSQIRLFKFNSAPAEIWRLCNLSEQLVPVFNDSYTEVHVNSIYGYTDMENLHTGLSEDQITQQLQR